MANKKGNTKKKSSTSKSVKKNNVNMKKNVTKDESKKIEEVNEKFGSDIWNKLILVCLVIIFLCLFYLLTVHITQKHSSDNTDSNTQSSKTTSNKSTSSKEDDSVSVSYDETIVGRSFSVDSGEYIIVYYDMSDDDIKSQYSSLITAYKSKEEPLNIYSVNMADGLNKRYAKEESNHNPSKVSEIAINGPTLIKFNDGSVEDYIEGYDEISSYLG